MLIEMLVSVCNFHRLCNTGDSVYYNGYFHPKAFHHPVKLEQSLWKVKERILFSCFKIQNKHKMNQRDSCTSLFFSAYILQLFINIL